MSLLISYLLHFFVESARLMKYPFKVSILLVLFSFITSLSYGQKELRKADKQLELKAFDLAIKNYSVFLEANPENIHAQLKLADAYRQTNDLLKAITWYEKAIDAGVTDGKHVLNYAHSLKKLGLYTKAKKAYGDYSQYDDALSKEYLKGCDEAIALLKKEQNFDLVAFDGNSKDSDFGAVTFNDKIVFSSFRSDLKRSSDKKNSSYIKNVGNQIYVAPSGESIDESELNFLRPDFKEIYGLGPISYSEDGKKVAYTKNNLFNGALSVDAEETDLSIYIADVEANGDFNNERPLVYNQVEYSYAFPHLSFNGAALYFSSNRPGGYGGFDLYVSYLKDGEWTKPENLGADVNSAQNEITPFLKDDVLYFSSDQVNGLGGYDVYTSNIKTGKWSTPNNMGKGINSPGDDYYMTVDGGGTFYLTSNRLGGSGKDDIYIASEVEKVEEIIAENVPSAVNLDELVAQKTEILTKDDINLQEAISDVSEADIAQVTRTSNSEDIFEESSEFKLYDHFELELTGAVKAGSSNSFDPSTERFFIQIASLSKSQGHVDDFSNISKLGNLYRFIQNRSTKIRLGSFESKGDAAEVLRKIKTQGYKDAFITTATLSDSNYEVINEGSIINYYSDESEDNAGPEYKVRLASYSDSSWFDADELKYLDGDLEQWTKGYWHIFILSGFNSIDEAESAKIKAVNRGFKEAEVVIDDRGVLKRLNQH